MKDKCYLGIDTSNYTTSVSIVNDQPRVLSNAKQILPVKPGEKGLRQSQALFEHMNAIPEIFQKSMKDIRNFDFEIAAVGVSNKPRPMEGSYMPVFRSGISYGKVIAELLNIPFYEFSHQEGHIEAVKRFSKLKQSKEFLAFHLSGGTSEILLCNEKDVSYDIQIIGGSKDISYGQLIDRMGTLLGIPFPCGALLDERVCILSQSNQIPSKALQKPMLKRIPVTQAQTNLSGIETQASKALLLETTNADALCLEVFEKIGDSLLLLMENAMKITGVCEVLFVGGVSSSQWIQNHIKNHCPKNLSIDFGKSEYSTDNAVGIALLTQKKHSDVNLTKQEEKQ